MAVVVAGVFIAKARDSDAARDSAVQNLWQSVHRAEDHLRTVPRPISDTDLAQAVTEHGGQRVTISHPAGATEARASYWGSAGSTLGGVDLWLCVAFTLTSAGDRWTVSSREVPDC
ncbi:hypothetical protein [Actinokineospora sp. NBRC 105648]|uniref:hypothetical protein n=1 Tax=Actinokineospora sp. NBRC 105648 TaxID=3032206 RepID=UPI0025536870|nr:hypothetical protein [Actinokineospora sp. NBRC 105648]